MVDGAALEKRSPHFSGAWVRIPPSPPKIMERCWSGLSGTPGERVSGFPTVGSNPTLSAKTSILLNPIPFSFLFGNPPSLSHSLDKGVRLITHLIVFNLPLC